MVRFKFSDWWNLTSQVTRTAAAQGARRRI